MIYKFDNITLSFKRTRVGLKWKTLTFLFVASSLTLLYITLTAFTKVEYINTEMVIKTEVMSEKEIFEIIDNLPFKYPDIVKAQAILETGYFKSKSFTEHNNLFGFKIPHRRITTAKGVALNHASYNSVEDCIIDRLIYEAKYMDNLSRKEYFKFLDQVYAEDKQYVQKLEKIIKNESQSNRRDSL